VLAELAREQTTRCIANPAFTQAVLFFRDGSHLRFEHSSRRNRWARPSAEGTTAGTICRGLKQFRLNARHLQLFFDDGSDAEFITSRSERGPEQAKSNGATLG
jgi:hypothetical protein